MGEGEGEEGDGGGEGRKGRGRILCASSFNWRHSDKMFQ